MQIKRIPFLSRVAINMMVGLFLSCSFSAQGQTVLQDSIVTQRLQVLRQSLEKDKMQTRLWWYGWLGAYSAATIGQGVVFFTSHDKNTRQDMALGAATTLLGAAGQFISPFIPPKEPEDFFSMPENSTDERMKKVLAGEELFREWSQKERLALSWQNHLMTGAVNLTSGLVTWIGFKRTLWDGVVNFALNTAITEAQIWSQPTLSKKNYKNYCRKYLDAGNTTSYATGINWYIEAKPGGIGLKVVF